LESGDVKSLKIPGDSGAVISGHSERGGENLFSGGKSGNNRLKIVEKTVSNSRKGWKSKKRTSYS